MITQIIFWCGHLKEHGADQLIVRFVSIHAVQASKRKKNNNNEPPRASINDKMSCNRTITVGLFPSVNSAKQQDAIIEQFQSLNTTTGFNLEFVSFDSYATHSTYPDVFVIDSFFLPHLVSQGLLVELGDNVLHTENTFSFAVASAKVQDKVYGIPQYMASQFLFSTSTNTNISQVSTVFDLVEKLNGDVKVVYPRVADDYQIVLNYSDLVNGANLPTSAAEVSKDFIAQYKSLINRVEVETYEEFFANLGKQEDAVLVGYPQYAAAAAANQSDLEKINVQLLSGLSGQKTFFVDVAVVNSGIACDEKKKVSIQLAQIIASTKVVVPSSDKTYYLPASKDALQALASGDALYKKLLDVVSAAEESNAKVFALANANTDIQVRTASGIIKPFIQHTSVATMRCLASDMVEKANSGHPGMPIGMSPCGYVLWKYFLNVSPKNSKWFNRDRFVLSNGHGCTLHYVLLHLTGFKVTMDDLKNFRQLDSITPGHPEYGWTDGIDATTGPLGQGITNCVGMAMASKHFAARFNTEDQTLMDNFIYTFCGDGDLMEGVALEALSVAGHHKLGNLIVLYDDNKITIDGSTELAFTEDIPTVATGFGWHVQRVSDGDSDLVSLKQAIINARKVTDKPSMICVRTTIGYASKKQGTPGVHGSPLGADGLKALKQVAGFNPDEYFVVPEKVGQEFAKIGERGNKLYDEWNKTFEAYAAAHPEKAQQLSSFINRKLPENWEKCLPDFTKQKPDLATRQCSQIILNHIAPVIGNLVGGSADLTPSNLTSLDISRDFQPESRDGRYIRFGVREHSMISIGNGLAYYGGLIPYVSTFLIFGGYGLGAMRLGALSHLPLIYVLTHDSIGLGEDGPTHQPVEMLPLMRSIPNLVVFRPADGTETNAAYKFAIESTKTPTAICLTRQGVPLLKRSTIEDALKGAYVAFQNGEFEKPDIIFVGTGSEVGIAIEGAKKLTDVKVNVVSMPAWELFDEQSLEYRRSVFIPGVPVLSVEASSVQGWTKYSHSQIGMTTFGASGPYKEVYKKFGITAEHVAERATKMLNVFTASNPAPLLPTTTPAFE